MNHRGQRACRDGHWKYLRVDGHDDLFDIPADERERANLGKRHPDRLAAMRSAWEAWNESVPPIPPGATVSLGYGYADMPQRCAGQPASRSRKRRAHIGMPPRGATSAEGTTARAIVPFTRSPTPPATAPTLPQP